MTILNSRTLTLPLNPISMPCVREGIINKDERAFKYVCDSAILLFTTKVINYFGARWYRGTEGPSSKFNPFLSSLLNSPIASIVTSRP